MQFKILHLGLIFISIITAYFIFLLNELAVGYMKGYISKEVDISISDVICFYSRVSLKDIYTIGEESKNIKLNNFNFDNIETAYSVINSLYNIKASAVEKCVKPIISQISDNENKGFNYSNLAYKLASYIPMFDTIKSGVSLVEYAMQLKSLFDLANDLRTLKFGLTYHEDVKNIAQGLGKLTYNLENLLNSSNNELLKNALMELKKILS